MPEVNHSGVVLSNPTLNPVVTVYENKLWKCRPIIKPNRKKNSSLASLTSFEILENIYKMGGYGAPVWSYCISVIISNETGFISSCLSDWGFRELN